MRFLLTALFCLPLLGLGACRGLHGVGNSAARDPMLVHSVYFTLREDTPAKRAALISVAPSRSRCASTSRSIASGAASSCAHSRSVRGSRPALRAPSRSSEAISPSRALSRGAN